MNYNNWVQGARCKVQGVSLCLLVAGFWLLFVGFTSIPGSGELKVKVSNIDPIEGDIYVAVYNSEESYMDIDLTAFQQIVPVEADIEEIIFEDVPDGEYAVTVFQDLNNNGKLDTKLIGIPKEPYGFSNNARGTMGPPKYDTAKFNVNGDTEIEITLIN